MGAVTGLGKPKHVLASFGIAHRVAAVHQAVVTQTPLAWCRGLMRYNASYSDIFADVGLTIDERTYGLYLPLPLDVDIFATSFNKVEFNAGLLCRAEEMSQRMSLLNYTGITDATNPRDIPDDGKPLFVYTQTRTYSKIAQRFKGHPITYYPRKCYNMGKLEGVQDDAINFLLLCMCGHIPGKDVVSGVAKYVG